MIKSVLDLNISRIPRIKLTAKVAPAVRFGDWDVMPGGKAKLLPTLGGVVLNYTLGDSCFKMESDHLQPDVSVRWHSDPDDSNALEGYALMCYSCIGNIAVVSDRESASNGQTGVVIGKHGGIDEVIIYFPEDAKKGLKQFDEIDIISCGMGLKAKNFPAITFMNIDPDLLVRLPLKSRNGRLTFPVKHVVPPQCMGSGLGSIEPFSSDYDIMMTDKATVLKHNLKELCIGDFVAIYHHECKHGFTFNKEYMSIGVVVHGSCLNSGHGPGVVIIATGPRTVLTLDTDQQSMNLKKFVGKIDKYVGKK